MTELLDKLDPTPVSTGEEDLRQFLSEIRRYPLLSQEEELALARRCAAGDEEAIRQMVSSNLRLVVSVARKYAGRGVPLLDLIQEGSIGLLAAARKFDYTLENRFSTYATKWINRGILRCLLEHGQLIRVPNGTAEQMRRVERAKSSLLQQTGDMPTEAQIAALLPGCPCRRGGWHSGTPAGGPADPSAPGSPGPPGAGEYSGTVAIQPD